MKAGTTTPARPELLAYEAATRAMHQWADGVREVKSPVTDARLRLAYQLWKLVTVRDSDRVAQAWFTGLNPQLDDVSPARLLRDGDLDEVGPRLLAAARAFAATGA